MQTPLTIKYIDPTYMIRAVPANPNDSIYCTVQHLQWMLCSYDFKAASEAIVGSFLNFWKTLGSKMQILTMPSLELCDSLKQHSALKIS
eukprot:2446959-Amphidinium_carterae.1